MKTYYQNGTWAEVRHILSDDKVFAIQHDKRNGEDLIFYQGDNLFREIGQELIFLYDKFVNLYFPDFESYDKGISKLPTGLLLGGQNSDIPITKEGFLNYVEWSFPCLGESLYRHLYVEDCQYLISTVQDLLESVEYCFVQYYVQIAQIECPIFCSEEVFTISSQKSMELVFFLETFFTKLYSILDLMAKLVYEFENLIECFSGITKLKSSDKTWGVRKHLGINNLVGTIFEDCEIIRQIESLRNEAVHNGAWEFRPRVFMIKEADRIVERYMIFPDFEEGRLATVKNRRHFFSEGTKVNDVLISIHNEFYQRLLSTLQYLNRTSYKTTVS